MLLVSVGLDGELCDGPEGAAVIGLSGTAGGRLVGLLDTVLTTRSRFCAKTVGAETTKKTNTGSRYKTFFEPFKTYELLDGFFQRFKTKINIKNVRPQMP